MAENSTMVFQLVKKRIKERIKEGQWLEAQQTAREWSQEICAQFGLYDTGNWKFFKRSVVAKWFGAVENKRFETGWSVEDVLQYADSFPGRTIRFSIFPNDIACKAKSFRLLSTHRGEWRRILEQEDHSIPLEIFPEASTLASICFRRFEARNETEIIYEAGKGQATYIFEEEQGYHSIVAASKLTGEYIYSRRTGPEDLDEIEKKLRSLIRFHDNDLSFKCREIFEALGVDYVSIEGYFDPLKFNKLPIVDMDLPFDLAFMGHDRE